MPERHFDRAKPVCVSAERHFGAAAILVDLVVPAERHFGRAKPVCVSAERHFGAATILVDLVVPAERHFGRVKTLRAALVLSNNLAEGLEGV